MRSQEINNPVSGIRPILLMCDIETHFLNKAEQYSNERKNMVSLIWQILGTTILFAYGL